MTVMSESEDDLHAEEGTHYIDILDLSHSPVWYICHSFHNKPARMLLVLVYNVIYELYLAFIFSFCLRLYLILHNI